MLCCHCAEHQFFSVGVWGRLSKADRDQVGSHRQRGTLGHIAGPGTLGSREHLLKQILVAFSQRFLLHRSRASTPHDWQQQCCLGDAQTHGT